MSIDPATEGWRVMRDSAMPAAIGDPWSKRIDGKWYYGMLTNETLTNPEGAVHGGILITFADHCLGMFAWEAAQRSQCVTIQLNTHFLAAVMPGDFVALDGEVTRATRGLVFVRGVLRVGERQVVAVDGIWRILRAPEQRIAG